MNEAESDLPLDLLPLKKAALLLKAGNHELRQKMLVFLHEKGKASVSVLYKQFHLEQSVASQHLAILRKAGFVTTQREGRHIYYSVNYDRLFEVQQFANDLLN